MMRFSPERSLRILVVEDHSELRRSLLLYLQMLGHNVEAAESRRVGQAALSRGRYDLVLMDLIMPDGHQPFVLPPHFHGEVITMSAYPPDSVEIQELPIFRMEVAQHLQKPFGGEELEQVLGEVSERRQATVLPS